MSVIIADFLRPRYQAKLRRYTAFLAEAPFSLAIAPSASGVSDAEIAVVYDERHFHALPYRALLRFTSSGRREELVTSLFQASYVLLLLVDQPQWLARMRAADPAASGATIVAAFDIDAATACRSSVKAWAEGRFLAPHDDGYAFFTVDVRGEVNVESWSADLLPVAVHFSMQREADRVHLASRVAAVDS